MTPAADPNIDRLNELRDKYQQSLAETNLIRYELDQYIQTLKEQGYSYPVLSRESGFAQGTVQLIVAKKLSESS
jgi:hypothetical protein